MTKQDSAASDDERVEDLDAFMERTKDLGYPASIRRVAWAINEPVEKVWRQFQAAREANQRV